MRKVLVSGLFLAGSLVGGCAGGGAPTGNTVSAFSVSHNVTSEAGGPVFMPGAPGGAGGPPHPCVGGGCPPPGTGPRGHDF